MQDWKAKGGRKGSWENMKEAQKVRERENKEEKYQKGGDLK